MVKAYIGSSSLRRVKRKLDKSQMRYHILIHLDNTLFINFFVESRINSINSDIGVPHLLDHRHKDTSIKGLRWREWFWQHRTWHQLSPWPTCLVSEDGPWVSMHFTANDQNLNVQDMLKKNERDHACSVALPSLSLLHPKDVQDEQLACKMNPGEMRKRGNASVGPRRLIQCWCERNVLAGNGEEPANRSHVGKVLNVNCYPNRHEDMLANVASNMFPPLMVHVVKWVLAR